MVTQTGRYAFRILGFLAAHRGERVSGERIAAATGIPSNYLSKILNQLSKRGLVTSQKGWGGGFTLKEAALKRPIGEVLAVFEGPDRVADESCVFGLPACDERNPCPLHHDWMGVRERYRAMLEQRTIADLTLKRG
ncbi:MAG: Rrf2 family transcriptional regulator [Gemmatimonadetes bacterium]|nr:Rrf2 family transcriptional regulator [Gemmatimonadota bacterium]